jgi:hypothetical protein
MTRSALLVAAVVCAAASAAGSAAAQAGQPGRTLRPFRSAEEYAQFHQRVAYVHRRRQAQEPPPPPAAPPAPSEPAAFSAANDGITSVQTAGVDEGGIVKVSGDYLVVLRRGRLFTVRIAGGALEPAAAADAFAPGLDPEGAWYDEMLVSGSMVVVVGYSYRRAGTEIGLFRIEPDGRLTHRSTHHLRSGDYYSSRNYASRLVGGKLVFYSPVPVRAGGGSAMSSLPGLRRWGAADTTFRPTASPARIYRPAGPIELLDQSPTLHTVTVCGIDDEELRCESTALFGPYGRVFYASPRAIYVWASRFPMWRDGDEGDREPVRSVVFRMPLDGSAPTGLRVSGGPVDPMSFLESADGHLNVLVRADGRGDGMWGAEAKQGDVALLRVPVSTFGDASGAAPAGRYRRLPAPAGWSFQNRYVGDWLLYGAGAGWGRPQGGGSKLFAVRWAGGEPAELALPHGVDRIEAMGSGAVVIGSDGRDLHFSAMRLGAGIVPADRFTRANASQGETRTHGFFYRADGAERGIVALPVVGGTRTGSARLRQGSAAVTFLRNEGFAFREMGDLAAAAEAVDDGCRASCVDWYGNARPIFLRGRIFALMGYEIVEGRDDDGRIRELRRVSYAPGAAR